MISLNDQIAQGTSDARLVNDVQALNSLSLAKDEAAQQRALMYNALNHTSPTGSNRRSSPRSPRRPPTRPRSARGHGRRAGAFFNSVDGTKVNAAQTIEI